MAFLSTIVVYFFLYLREFLVKNFLNVSREKGGYFIPYKGESAEDELTSADAAIRVLGGNVEKIENPSKEKNAISGHKLIFIRKCNNTPKRFPRKPGIAKKSPIR